MPNGNKHRPLPPIEHLRDTYYYNPETGIVKNRYTGRELRSGKVNVVPYGIFLTCRIVYAIFHGIDPGESIVDHIDVNNTNNKINNLRLATKAQNGFNGKLRKNNTSGYKCVAKSGDKWVAYIDVEYKRTSLGTFDTPELAHQAYCDAATKYHGKFANFG